MAQSPLVSVSMVTYNHRPYIEKAINSVLSQKTDFPIELVIGEDGSSDGTRDLVAAYQKKFPDQIRLITSSQNVGARKNAYRVLKACRGKYVAFCEGDDYWHEPLKLQKQVDYLETRPDVGMVHSSYDVHEVGTERVIKDYVRYRRFSTPSDPSLADIITGCRVTFRIQTCAVMLRWDLFDRIIEADPYLHKGDQFLMGDTQVWAEVAAASKIGFIPESLATYRLGLESASRSQDIIRNLQFELSDCEMKLYLCKKYDLPASVTRNRELAWCETSLRLAFHKQNGKQALEVRRKKAAFTVREWLLYVGARYRPAHSLLRMAVVARERIIQSREEPSA